MFKVGDLVRIGTAEYQPEYGWENAVGLIIRRHGDGSYVVKWWTGKGRFSLNECTLEEDERDLKRV